MSFYLRKLLAGFILLAGAAALWAQNSKPAPSPMHGLELPAALQTKIIAGKTVAGTEVRAKLTMATLMDGVVIPQDAVLSGVVEESVAKTEDAPALLKIKFDTARWKKGSARINLYLAGCYYPIEFNTGPDTQSGFHGDIGVTMGSAPPSNIPRPTSGNGGGLPPMDASRQDTYPDPRPTGMGSEISTHWVRIEKVDTAVTPDGGLQLISSDRNLKLDKGTVYLLRNSPAPPVK